MGGTEGGRTYISVSSYDIFPGVKKEIKTRFFSFPSTKLQFLLFPLSHNHKFAPTLGNIMCRL